MQELSCNGIVIWEQDILAIMRFTSLTSLQLASLRGSANLQVLQSLGLQKLSLIGYIQARQTLFAPGSINPFSDLQTIFISEEDFDLEAQCARTMEAETARQLLKTVSFLQSLPSLQCVSGRSEIFLGFREGSSNWKRTSVSSAKKDSHVCLSSICLTAEQTWKRSNLF